MDESNQIDLQMEQELVERAKTDDLAFEQLYNLYFPKIYGFVYKRVGQKQICEDIVSEVFMKVFTNLKDYRDQGMSFGCWVYKIATNKLIDYYRSGKKQMVVGVEMMENIGSKENIGEQTANKMEVEEIQTVISTLAENYQQIINLKFFAELSNQEIAKILKISENNAGVIIFRALKKFREEYGKKNL
ncbi:MAG: RNA polymerase sigma factor [Patescibacteria group bacterium]